MKESLEGKRFGKLVAVEPTKMRKNGYVMWKCRCDCGNEILVESRHLKRGTIHSCGCMPKIRRRQDLTGRRFGKLTVLEDTGRMNDRSVAIWRCQCDCGNIIELPGNQLLSNNNKSCGCLAKPPLKDWIGKRFGDLTVTSYAGKMNGSHYWHCRCICGRELDVRQSNLMSGRTKGCGQVRRMEEKNLEGQRFGELVVLSYAGKKDGAKLWKCRCDCGKEVEIRQSNLLSGHTQTCGHKSPLDSCHFVDGTCIEVIASKTIFSNNTSGIRGVYRNRKNGKWVAQITFKGQTLYLGSYEKKEDAAKARGCAEEELFDGFVQQYWESQGCNQ